MFYPGYESQANEGADTGSQEKRVHSFVRIGRDNVLDWGNDPGLDVSNGYGLYGDINQREITPRDVDKRISSFVRIGKSTEPNDYIDALKRISSFVRIGKNNQKRRPSSFVRIGKDGNLDDADAQKRNAFVRIGKADGQTLMSVDDGAIYKDMGSNSDMYDGNAFVQSDGKMVEVDPSTLVVDAKKEKEKI